VVSRASRWWATRYDSILGNAVLGRDDDMKTEAFLTRSQRRTLLGMSLKKLAEAVGVTAHQIRKY
jgi:hypothetical protein